MASVRSVAEMAMTYLTPNGALERVRALFDPMNRRVVTYDDVQPSWRLVDSQFIPSPSDVVPTLPAYRRVLRDPCHDLLLAWCEHCRVWHGHPVDGGWGAGDGEVWVAECECSRSPYRATGYRLHEMWMFSDRESSQVTAWLGEGCPTCHRVGR